MDGSDEEMGGIVKQDVEIIAEKKPKEKEPEKTEIWNDLKEPLAEDEELDYDGSAYVMMHRSKVEWPCLSVDMVLRERCTSVGMADPKGWFDQCPSKGLDSSKTKLDKHKRPRHVNDKFPMCMYMVAGS